MQKSYLSILIQLKISMSDFLALFNCLHFVNGGVDGCIAISVFGKKCLVRKLRALHLFVYWNEMT